MQRAALVNNRCGSTVDEAAALIAALDQCGIATRAFTRARRRYVHAAVKGAPSAGLAIECRPRGAAERYLTEGGEAFDDAAQAAHYTAWLFGIGARR